jgi:hypothetical protein
VAEHYGPLAIPAQAPAAGQAVGDPALSYLLAFLKAFMQDDGGVTAAWTVSGVAPGIPVVRGVYPYDPTEGGFVENQLPALYGWRSEILPPEQLADDVRIRTSTVTLLWVFPFTPQGAVQMRRESMTNAIHAAVDRAIERGRTPSFKVTGDTDTNAATLGSFAWNWMAFWQLRVGGARPAKLDIAITGAKGERETRHYDAVQMTLSVDEELTFDLSAYAPLAGLDLIIHRPDGTTEGEDLIPPT